MRWTLIFSCLLYGQSTAESFQPLLAKGEAVVLVFNRPLPPTIRVTINTSLPDDTVQWGNLAATSVAAGKNTYNVGVECSNNAVNGGFGLNSIGASVWCMALPFWGALLAFPTPVGAASMNCPDLYVQLSSNLCYNASSDNTTVAVYRCSCPSGTFDCDNNRMNGCEVNLTADPSHCGSCGNQCALNHATPSCTQGNCTIAQCATGWTDCNMVAADGCEVQLLQDTANCGVCGQGCAVAPGSTATCNNGLCGIACEHGFGDCDNSTDTGCETNLNTTTSACGSCGNQCALDNATPLCTQGNCVIEHCILDRTKGWTDCNMVAADGCEVALLIDTANCGACGEPCPAGPNSTATCGDGACGLTCDQGFGDCDYIADNGCETNLNTNTSACGACGAACNLNHATASCTSGTCTVAQCSSGYADCDHNSSNGCETDLTTTSNCGTCGAVCNLDHATAACMGGICTVAQCSSGWGDCDGNPSDGCETHLDTDTSNCGGCNQGCPVGAPNQQSATCTNGFCGMTCITGYGDCDHNPADGCETSLLTPTNCGACGNLCPSGVCAGGSCV